MNRNTFSGQMFRLGTALVAAACAYGLWQGYGLHEITSDDAEGVNTLILLIGSIYAVIFVCDLRHLGPVYRLENFIMRECNSLNELLRFSDFVNPDARRSIRRDVAAYVQRVVRSEWPALGERHRDNLPSRRFRNYWIQSNRTGQRRGESGTTAYG